MDKTKDWLLGMIKSFQVHDNYKQFKGRVAIFYLNGGEDKESYSMLGM